MFHPAQHLNYAAFNLTHKLNKKCSFLQTESKRRHTVLDVHEYIDFCTSTRMYICASSIYTPYSHVHHRHMRHHTTSPQVQKVLPSIDIDTSSHSPAHVHIALHHSDTRTILPTPSIASQHVGTRCPPCLLALPLTQSSKTQDSIPTIHWRPASRAG